MVVVEGSLKHTGVLIGNVYQFPFNPVGGITSVLCEEYLTPLEGASLLCCADEHFITLGRLINPPSIHSQPSKGLITGLVPSPIYEEGSHVRPHKGEVIPLFRTQSGLDFHTQVFGRPAQVVSIILMERTSRRTCYEVLTIALTIQGSLS